MATRRRGDRGIDHQLVQQDGSADTCWPVAANNQGVDFSPIFQVGDLDSTGRAIACAGPSRTALPTPRPRRPVRRRAHDVARIDGELSALFPTSPDRGARKRCKATGTPYPRTAAQAPRIAATRAHRLARRGRRTARRLPAPSRSQPLPFYASPTETTPSMCSGWKPAGTLIPQRRSATKGNASTCPNSDWWCCRCLLVRRLLSAAWRPTTSASYRPMNTPKAEQDRACSTRTTLAARC